jgi:hypothetical protein
VAGSCDHYDERSGCVKTGSFLTAERLGGCQEGFWSVVSINWYISMYTFQGSKRYRNTLGNMCCYSEVMKASARVQRKLQGCLRSERRFSCSYVATIPFAYSNIALDKRIFAKVDI